MSPAANAALIAWPIVAILIFSWQRGPRGAAIVAALGWLFLPVASIPLPGLPDYSKPAAVSLMLVVGAFVWAGGRVGSLRWRLIDTAAALVCLSPVASSVTNGLGVYDGIAESMAWGIMWIGPYFAGRVFFQTPGELGELARVAVVAAIAYAPLCLYEARMSPQLHTMVYGYFPHVFAQTKRFGGWRPQVFMDHGLMAGLWMSGGAMVGIILWRAKAFRSLLGVPMVWWVGLMVVTAVLTRSAGAIFLTIVMGGALVVLRTPGVSRLAILLPGSVAAYIGYRLLGGDAGWLVSLTEGIAYVGERSDSLAYRIDTENEVVSHALEKPLFGWGGWGRHGVQNEYGELTTISDSLWVLTLGQKGLVGLAALYAILLGPVVMWLRPRILTRGWHPEAAPAVALAALVCVFAIDSLLNAMPSPLYTMAMGGLVSTHYSVKRAAAAARARLVAGQIARQA